MPLYNHFVEELLRVVVAGVDITLEEVKVRLGENMDCVPDLTVSARNTRWL